MFGSLAKDIENKIEENSFQMVLDMNKNISDKLMEYERFSYSHITGNEALRSPLSDCHFQSYIKRDVFEASNRCDENENYIENI